MANGNRSSRGVRRVALSPGTSVAGKSVAGAAVAWALAAGTLLLGLVPGVVAAQSPAAGYWLTQDGDGVIEVYACGDGLCARIAGFFLARPWDPSPRDYRGVPQCGLPLVNDARPVGPDRWRGRIVNPKNGKVYGLEVRLTPEDKLVLRGFLGLPLLGQTQVWTRYRGKVPADCRIMQPAPVRPMARERGRRE